MKRPGMQNWMDCFKKKLFGSKWGWGGALAGGNSGAQWTPSGAPPQDRDAEKSPPFCLLAAASSALQLRALTSQPTSKEGSRTNLASQPHKKGQQAPRRHGWHISFLL